MFFLSVTRDSTASSLDAPSVREFRCGTWTVTAAADGWLSSVAETGGQVIVREAAPLGAGSPLVFAEASVGANGRSFELYKAVFGGKFVFYHFGARGEAYCATHIRLLRQAGVAIEEDEGALPELFVYRYVTAPRTLYKRLSQLVAGERVRFEFDGDAWRPKGSEYFSHPRPAPDAGIGADLRYGAYSERAEAALRGAMAPLKQAGVTPHVLLSGGLDSSVLFRVAQTELSVGESLSASYSFEPEAENVETRYALTAAEALGSRHQLFVPTIGDFLRGFLEAAWAMEEPVVHLQSVLMLLMHRDGMPPGRAGVVVGEGADSLFGLQLHSVIRKLDAKAATYRPLRPVLGLPPVLAALRAVSRAAGRGGDLVDVMEKRWDPQDPLTDPRHVLSRQHVFTDDAWVHRRFGVTARDVFANRLAVMKRFQGRSIYELLSLHGFYADASLVQRQWTRMAEVADKWTHYPYHDPAVLESGYTAPWDVKLAEPKAVLRGVARRLGIPEPIVSRPKAGFSANAKWWAVPGGVLEPLIPLAAKVWGEPALRAMQTTHMPTAYLFLVMMYYAMWKRMCIDGEPLSTLREELERSMSDRKTNRYGDR